MSTKGIADIVFCLDASGSMAPCFRGVREHIGEFLKGLKSNPQFNWDWRIDFLAHSAGDHGFNCTSLNVSNMTLLRALYHEQGSDRFFTRDAEQFRTALSKVEVLGDEAPLIALDICLDFPWREGASCHRVIIMMTDEPFETGAMKAKQLEKLPELIQKVQQLRVMLYLVAPPSSVFDALSAVEKSVYEEVQVQGNGLANVNFREVLLEIGKSVSVSQSQTSAPEAVVRGLFDQPSWTLGGRLSRFD